MRATLEPRKYQATVGHISPTCGQDSQGSRREMGDLFFEHPPTAVICLPPPYSPLTRRDGVLSVGDSSLRLGRVFNVSYSPPLLSTPAPSGERVRATWHASAQVPRHGGIALPGHQAAAFFDHHHRKRDRWSWFLFLCLFARIVMHSVVVQAHVRKTYWDELADLPTQPCLCTVSPHQGSSKWEARGRRLGLSLRTQPAVLDTMARSSSISTTGRTSRRFAAGNEALRSSLSSNPLFRLTLPCKSR